ncbi:putative Gluconolactonase [Vibrio nigripulchritudo SFn27]|uniref:Putative Gluconolactonase n=1 Tax=Vibrio nigripulchritudo TaxID=28173 RepID=U4KIE8_9VIBR|nr:SMP-30/gluconolactonase/LRE family protein [Vibrio nigripulchritudo]CCN81276.1 putative Gluconolactonase [Vibrio nigripulchritudo BLFn1]CCN86599.1 putative Gluconolactonase [Vibrio nigripulchritudo SFn27]CCN97154.1 putative Gluconolactonase [Vibrio nigripulchritudo ENn2]CCO43013.1 putative Gluconolactonase [Vibrio nigripulchritudo SFn135]CCO50649.1 putative Gluconolactonase [Vibrio nigripulchritudo Wn13]
MDKFNAVSSERFSVGESPLWDAKNQRVVFVDIIGKLLVSVSLDGTCETIRTEDFPTACARVAQSDKHWIVAFANGVALLDKTSGKIIPVCQPDSMVGNRLNEGKCDPQGRFWVSSMQTNLHADGSGKAMTRESGALFSLDDLGNSSQWTDYNIGLTNTMAWSPDRSTFYFGDSMNNVIWAFDYDEQSGEVSNQSVFFEGYPNGDPDGSCIDDEGYLWNCRFGGSEIIRIAPDGSLDKVVKLPVTNPTSCTFGGAEGKTLFITSAQFSLSDEQLAKNPLEGALLSAEMEIGGNAENAYQMSEQLRKRIGI